MFRMQYSQPCALQGEIVIANPVRHLGPLKDVGGKSWDVRAIYSKGGETIVAAVPSCELNPYYTDTSTRSYGVIYQTWKPYLVRCTHS